MSHVWNEKGTYNIRVKVRDSSGAMSDWSDSVTMRLPLEKKLTKTKLTNHVEKQIERFPNSKKIFFLSIFADLFDINAKNLYIINDKE